MDNVFTIHGWPIEILLIDYLVFKNFSRLCIHVELILSLYVFLQVFISRLSIVIDVDTVIIDIIWYVSSLRTSFHHQHTVWFESLLYYSHYSSSLSKARVGVIRGY